MRKLAIACAVALGTTFAAGPAAQAAGVTFELVQGGYHHHRHHRHHRHHHWDRRWHRYWHHGRYRHHRRDCYIHRYVTYRHGERIVHVNRNCR